MATMNDLSSDGSPLEGRYMVQEKRITRLDICSKGVVDYIASRTLWERQRTMAK